MKLSTLAENLPPYHTDKRAIMQLLDELAWDNGDEYFIKHDGTVVEGPGADLGKGIYLNVPTRWERFPVKFGPMPNFRLNCVRCKLKTLENAPTEVKSLTMQDMMSLATLRAGPQIVREDITLVDLGLTTLAGFPSVVGGSVFLRKLEHIASLEGIPASLEVHRSFEIHGCTRLTSLRGMPSVGGGVVIGDHDELPAIRFPKGFSMNGMLMIGSTMAWKLSPTLVLVPGLTEIDWAASGYRYDILKLFNHYLKLPKKPDTYFRLQEALIEEGLDDIADL